MVYPKILFDGQEYQIKTAQLSRDEKDAAGVRKGLRRLEPGLIKNFENYGIKLYRLSKIERATFKKAARKVRIYLEKTAQPDALKLLDQGKAPYQEKK